MIPESGAKRKLTLFNVSAIDVPILLPNQYPAPAPITVHKKIGAAQKMSTSLFLFRSCLLAYLLKTRAHFSNKLLLPVAFI
jgi:hypothetical protein